MRLPIDVAQEIAFQLRKKDPRVQQKHLDIMHMYVNACLMQESIQMMQWLRTGEQQ